MVAERRSWGSSGARNGACYVLSMDIERAVEQVRRLSDGELLAGLSGVLGANRRVVALVLVHLAEVEERRLHLLAGYGSLFVYCTGRLAMSEDEAYRRIRVARLARRFPIVFDGLVSGQISLSVAALVAPQLTEANHAALLGAVSGKTVQRAREVLAAWSPKPDVLPLIRKLPERSAEMGWRAGALVGAAGGSACGIGGAEPGVTSVVQGHAMAGREHAHAALIGGDRVMPSPTPFDGSSGGDGQSWSATGVASHIEQGVDVGTRDRAVGIAPGATRASQASCVVEPLSPGRYRVQFTADAELKRQIDLARDLLRHAVPRGDLATLVSRALELLIEATLRRRFGSRSRKGRGATGESVHRVAVAALAPTRPARPMKSFPWRARSMGDRGTRSWCRPQQRSRRRSSRAQSPAHRSGRARTPTRHCPAPTLHATFPVPFAGLCWSATGCAARGRRRTVRAATAELGSSTTTSLHTGKEEATTPRTAESSAGLIMGSPRSKRMVKTPWRGSSTAAARQSVDDARSLGHPT